MTRLLSIFGIDAPENTVLQSADVSFRGVWSVGTAVLVVLVFGAFVAVSFLLYFRERGRLGLVPRSLMALLRIAALGFLLALLLRPVLLMEYAGERPRSIGVLLDDSKSMQQRDKRTNAADQVRVAIAKKLVPPTASISETTVLADIALDRIKDPSRVTLVKDVLENSDLNLLAGLKKHGPVRVFLFGDQVRSELEKSGSKDEKNSFVAQLKKRLTANQEKTALGDALEKMISRSGADLPAALVVMTDGRNNAGKAQLLEAAEDCARAGVPLYIYGVGSSEGGTLQLIDMATQGTLFYDDIVSVPIRWRAQGFKKGTLQIQVLLGDKKVAEKEIAVRNGQDLREVLSFTPKKKDNYPTDNLELKVQLRLKGNNEFHDEMKKQVRLSDSKVKVLYVENVPRWEFKFLQPMMVRDHRLDPHFILVSGDPRLVKNKPFLPSFPKREELLKYDVIILGDVAAAYLGKERLDLIQEYVRDFRGGLIVIAGQQNMPATYTDTLAEVLPVEFLPAKFNLDSEERPVAYRPKLTQAGEMRPMLALADDPNENLKIWENLPGFYWNYPVLGLRPGATALLVHPYRKMGKQPMPILATQYYGKGEVLFLATDETWRWRYNAGDIYYNRFWGQVIYKLALPHLLGDSSRHAQFTLERSEAILNREGYIYARLLDEDFRPLKADEVSATLEYLDAKPGQQRLHQVTFQSIPGRPGEYRLFRKHAQQGRFEVKVKMLTSGTVSAFQYRVKLPPRHELEEAGLAEEELREATRVSGGKFYREEDLHHLISDITAKTTPFVLRQEILLWNPLAFFIFVGLMTTEWIVRKFANLS